MRVQQTKAILWSLTTVETKAQVICRGDKQGKVQLSGTEQFKEDQMKLNLQRNAEGLEECRGRIHGSYPF